MIMRNERVGGSVNTNLPAQNFKLPSPFLLIAFEVYQSSFDQRNRLRHDPYLCSHGRKKRC